jgi:endonuclease-3
MATPGDKSKTKIAAIILERLEKLYPNAHTALNWSNPMELLVAVVLSAQCTDKRVNLVTADLFKKYKSAAEFAGADQSQLEQDIKPTGFFRNKSKNIIAAATIITDRYNGQVPRTMPELIGLPGIARKSANIILAEAYNEIAGIPVDTHVKRLTRQK